MGILSANPAINQGHGPDATEQASKALEALVLKQLLQASGAFRETEAAGSSLHADLFAEALAEAVANSGGLGISSQIQQSLPTPSPSLPFLAPGRSALGSPLTLVPGGRVTSDFGKRVDPLDGHRALHSGVDIAAPEGTSILAAADGVVRHVGARGNYGSAVELDHGSGVTTLYGHASELLVREGERVTRGQTIARVGHTGRATGPHLHFEVRVGDHPVDPTQALKAYATCADDQVGLE